MEDIFEKEGEVIAEAENLLQSKVFHSPEDEEQYEKLLHEYKRMLKQMRMMVKMSDIMQSKLNSLTSELEKLSQIDGLTALYNRRYFNETYQKEWQNAAESESYLGILMIDIDHFKKYNDTFGHLEGDRCLQKIAASIMNSSKGFNSFTARFGGEEFVVLLKEASFDDCETIAKKILEEIDLLNIPDGPDPDLGFVTVSIGIGYMLPEKSVKSETLINIADQALYRAKKSGRHCYKA